MTNRVGSGATDLIDELEVLVIEAFVRGLKSGLHAIAIDGGLTDGGGVKKQAILLCYRPAPERHNPAVQVQCYSVMSRNCSTTPQRVNTCTNNDGRAYNGPLIW